MRSLVQPLLSGVIIIGLLMVACTEQRDPRSPGEASPLVRVAGAAASATPTPAFSSPPDMPQGNGPLVIALSAADFGLLPQSARQRPWQEALFDYIVGASPTGELDQSGLAVLWTSSRDMKTWTLRLRNGVLFHDGRTAGAEDVKGTLAFHARPGSAVLGAVDLRENIAAVETPDPATVVVRLKNPDFLFIHSRLSPRDYSVTGLLLPAAYLDEAGPDVFDAAPIGTGPYRVAEADASMRLSLAATDRHWLYRNPGSAALVFERVPEETLRVSLLRTGKADVVESSRGSAAELRADGFAVFTKAEAGIAGILMHEQYRLYGSPEGNPLRQSKVREALGIAIDRQSIAGALFHGLATPTVTYPVVSWDPAYQPAPQVFDPERARRLLAEAGYPQGFTLDVVVFSFDGIPEGSAVMATVTQGWERIGVRTGLRPMDFATYRKVWFAQAFGRPTVGGVVLFPNRFNATALLGFTSPQSSSRLTEDAELQRLALQWQAADDLDAYVLAGRRLQRAVVEQQVFSTTLVEVGAAYAAGPRVQPDWRLGKSPYSIAINQVAALP